MTCEEKHVFLSKRDARSRADQLRGRGLGKQRPYRCMTCGLWHLTSAGPESRAWFREQKRAARAGGAR